MRDRNSDRQRARTKDRQSLCPGWGAWGLPGLRCERGLAVGQVKGVLSAWGVANPQMQRCGSEREYDSRFQELKVVTITPACPHMNHALLCLPYLLSSSHLKVADWFSWPCDPVLVNEMQRYLCLRGCCNRISSLLKNKTKQNENVLPKRVHYLPSAGVSCYPWHSCSHLMTPRRNVVNAARTVISNRVAEAPPDSLSQDTSLWENKHISCVQWFSRGIQPSVAAA